MTSIPEKRVRWLLYILHVLMEIYNCFLYTTFLNTISFSLFWFRHLFVFRLHKPLVLNYTNCVMSSFCCFLSSSSFFYSVSLSWTLDYFCRSAFLSSSASFLAFFSFLFSLFLSKKGWFESWNSLSSAGLSSSSFIFSAALSSSSFFLRAALSSSSALYLSSLPI